MSKITDPNTYQILIDKNGYYISTEDGWDLTPRRRFLSFREAEQELGNWIVEHEAALQEEEDDDELYRRMAEDDRRDDEENERGDYR
jgi:hypothetical protein